MFSALIQTLCSVLGTIVNILELFNGRKKITYIINRTKVITEKIPGLKLQYYNQEIESLSATLITIWNSGTGTIDKTDIAETKPLIISAPALTNILGVQIIKETEEGTVVSAIIKDGKILIDFEFLNEKDGAILEVYHTGTADDFSLDCRIKGGKKPQKRVWGKDSELKYSSLMAFIIFAAIMICCILSNLKIIPTGFNTVLTFFLPALGFLVILIEYLINNIRVNNPPENLRL